MKIVIIGAGSSNFGRGQMVGILQSADLGGLKTDLWLVDIDEPSVEGMYRLGLRIKEHLGSGVNLYRTTDRRAALAGADYVIVSVAVRRMELWEQDFRVPLALGFKHNYGENGGPGALFHALRNLELIVPICRDVEELCPNALVLNFSNPEARILHGICHLTRVKAAGICHGVSMGRTYAAKVLDVPYDDLEVTSAGINHLYVFLSVRDKRSGEELLPKLKELSLPRKEEPLFRKMLEVFDVFTFPADSHIGEYFSFGSEYSGAMWSLGVECKQCRPVGDPWPAPPWMRWSFTGAEIQEYASCTRPLDERVLNSSTEITVPVICDIAMGRSARHDAVNVINTERYVENLPEHGVIEVPAMTAADGIRPIRVGAVPEPYAAFMRRQHEIHAVLTEAYRTHSKKMLLQALLLDPVVNSISSAERLLDHMLWLQKDYLPEFA